MFSMCSHLSIHETSSVLTENNVVLRHDPLYATIGDRITEVNQTDVHEDETTRVISKQSSAIAHNLLILKEEPWMKALSIQDKRPPAPLPDTYVEQSSEDEF